MCLRRMASPRSTFVNLAYFAAASLLGTTTLFGQEPLPTFEAASIKRSGPESRGLRNSEVGDRLIYNHTTLKNALAACDNVAPLR